MGSTGPVDVSGACEPLKTWNLHDDLDSNGAIVFRRFASQILNDFTTLPTGPAGRRPRSGSGDDLHDAVLGRRPGAHAERAEHGEPAGAARARGRRLRPRGGGHPARRPAARRTSTSTAAARTSRSTAGPGSLGVFNAINVSWDPEKDGYGDVAHGSSFMMAAQFVDGQLPGARPARS